MNINELFRPEIMSMLLIFFARIFDVSLGTIRIILISRGYRYIAPILGFVEVLIWLTAIKTVLGNVQSIFGYIVYAGGFATGNYVGMLLEAKIAIGYQSIRIITSKKVSALPLVLRDEGFDITTVEGLRTAEEVILLYTVVPRGNVERVIEIVNLFEPSAFITIEDVKSHLTGFWGKKDFFNLFGRLITKKK
jgi:uncharacterized protein YebE (UPF0316 family)